MSTRPRRVVYADVDPVAVAHGQAILAGVPRRPRIRGDLRDPLAVLADPAVTRLIDLASRSAC